MNTQPPVTTRQNIREANGTGWPLRIGLAVAVALAALYFWVEHRAYLFIALPFLFLLACPVIHLFMHHGHGGHDMTQDTHGDKLPPDAFGRQKENDRFTP